MTGLTLGREHEVCKREKWNEGVKVVASYTAADVQALRKQTGAGMLDAKKALDETEGDSAKAAQLLREKGLAGASKRSDRENEQGACSMALLGEAGAIVELKCETDFVAKSEAFTSTVDEMARAVAQSGVEAVNEFASRVDELKLTLKENIAVGRVVRVAGGANSVIDGYLHLQSGRGVVGVLVRLEGGSKEIAHELALHVAFARPTYLSRDEVPKEIVDAERATLETMTRNEGKPEASLSKIVEGRLDGFFKAHCLLEQSFVKDEKQRVKDVLGDAQLVEYALVVVGG
jgi:elongation factor Ts